MTQTIQTHSICTIRKTEKPKLTENEEIIRDILSVCDSLYKLHETLSRFAYVLQRKNYRSEFGSKWYKNADNLMIVHKRGD